MVVHGYQFERSREPAHRPIVRIYVLTEILASSTPR